MKRYAHMTLMGKGGVGKSLISSFNAQYLQRTSEPVFCADTDPTNPTFSDYPGIGAKHIQILRPDMNIDRANFDMLIGDIIEHRGDSVIDNGGSSFLPMMAYMLENGVIQMLASEGIEIIIHSVLVGGSGQLETSRMLDTILSRLSARVVVWINEKEGPLYANGSSFEETATYEINKERILGVVTIIERSADTFGRDLRTMTTAKRTFSEFAAAPETNIMSKSRMQRLSKDIYDQLDLVFDNL